jgi:phage FluMu protein Com
MKITLCGICGEELNEPETSDNERFPCPVCGSRSRKYENEDYFMRCKVCNKLMDHVDFIDSKGLCWRCKPPETGEDTIGSN